MNPTQREGLINWLQGRANYFYSEGQTDVGREYSAWAATIAETGVQDVAVGDPVARAYMNGVNEYMEKEQSAQATDRNAVIEECATVVEDMVGTTESMLEAAAAIRALAQPSKDKA